MLDFNVFNNVCMLDFNVFHNVCMLDFNVSDSVCMLGFYVSDNVCMLDFNVFDNVCILDFNVFDNVCMLDFNVFDNVCILNFNVFENMCMLAFERNKRQQCILCIRICRISLLEDMLAFEEIILIDISWSFFFPSLVDILSSKLLLFCQTYFKMLRLFHPVVVSVYLRIRILLCRNLPAMKLLQVYV
jgi:hypothetical protein